jgi:hypothetical protein
MKAVIPDPLEWEIGPEACENGEQGASACVWGKTAIDGRSTLDVARGFTFLKAF